MNALVVLGILLIMLGFAFITIGALRSAPAQSRVEAGGVVFIGPIPIVFGTSSEAVVVSALAAILLLLGVLLWILLS